MTWYGVMLHGVVWRYVMLRVTRHDATRATRCVAARRCVT